MRKIVVIFLLIMLNCIATSEASDKLKNVEVSSLDGTKYKFSTVLGKKKIVINFWASWCTSCIQELPELRELKEKYPNAEFLGINAGERKNIIKKFLKKYNFPYMILLDKDRALSKSLGVKDLPRTFVIDKSGKIIFDDIRPPKKI